MLYDYKQPGGVRNAANFFVVIYNLKIMNNKDILRYVASTDTAILDAYYEAFAFRAANNWMC